MSLEKWSKNVFLFFFTKICCRLPLFIFENNVFVKKKFSRVFKSVSCNAIYEQINNVDCPWTSERSKLTSEESSIYLDVHKPTFVNHELCAN